MTKTKAAKKEHFVKDFIGIAFHVDESKERVSKPLRDHETSSDY